jgi:hypothetical protein
MLTLVVTTANNKIMGTRTVLSTRTSSPTELLPGTLAILRTTTSRSQVLPVVQERPKALMEGVQYVRYCNIMRSSRELHIIWTSATGRPIRFGCIILLHKRYSVNDVVLPFVDRTCTLLVYKYQASASTTSTTTDFYFLDNQVPSNGTILVHPVFYYRWTHYFNTAELYNFYYYLV